MIQTILDYYRLPVESLGGVSLTADAPSGDSGYFQFGANNICYGRSRSGTSSDIRSAAQFDALRGVHRQQNTLQLPFDFSEIVENLRQERYRQKGTGGLEVFATSEPVRKLYYLLRKCLPFPVRRRLQKLYFRDWKNLKFPAWPVDCTVDNLQRELLGLLLDASSAKRLPFIWFWPDGAPNALIMTHDVETSVGRDFTFKLMDLDDSYGIKASYQVIPEKRYEVPDEYVSEIRKRGCEFNIHDLNHDGHLYRERTEFERRAAGINAYAKQYQAQGFRAGAMYRRQDWFDAFAFSYDMSVPNVAHLEPVRGGCCTVMPYFIGKILELPLTTVQDYSLFQILDDYSIDLWKLQLDLIKEKNGLMSLLTHPDYLIESRGRRVYESFLAYLRQMIDHDKIWAALPGDLDRWWRARSQMKLVQRGSEWDIVGPGSERAKLAYATLEADKLVYRYLDDP